MVRPRRFRIPALLAWLAGVACLPAGAGADYWVWVEVRISPRGFNSQAGNAELATAAPGRQATLYDRSGKVYAILDMGEMAAGGRATLTRPGGTPVQLSDGGGARVECVAAGDCEKAEAAALELSGSSVYLTLVPAPRPGAGPVEMVCEIRM